METEMEIDFVLCSVPKSDISAPLLGPVLLKAVLKKEGNTCKVLDFNIDLYTKKDEFFHGKEWNEIENNFRFEESFEEMLPNISDLLDRWIDDIMYYNPRIVGFNAFTSSNTFVIRELCNRLRKYDIIIIVGGANTNYVGPGLLRDDLIDYYVIGEGEKAIVEIAKGNFDFIGINGGTTPNINISNNPMPDYSDLDLSLYKGNSFYVTGSRGCPRACTFCEVNYKWSSFRTRSPQSIVDEMVHYYKIYDIKNFYFTDSLLNGNLKHLRELCELLKDVRKQMPIEWHAFFMIRNQRQMPPDLFHLIDEAGCKTIKIGIESGSQTVRKHMKKGFIDEDLDYSLGQYEKTNINLDLLFIIGYPTETEADYIQTKHFFAKYKDYKCIKFVRLAVMVLTHGVPIWDQIDELGIYFDDNSMWKTNKLDFKLRLERYFEMRNYIKSLNYKIRPDADLMLHELYKKKYEQLK